MIRKAFQGIIYIVGKWWGTLECTLDRAASVKTKANCAEVLANMETRQIG